MTGRLQFCRIERRNGFTLMEVIVSLGIIGLLIAMLLPAVQRVRESARAVECKSHLHQIGVAIHNHCEKSGGRLPHTKIPLRKLLPLFEMASLESYLDGNGPPGQSIPPGPTLYVCPSDPQATTYNMRTSYPINNGSRLRPLNGMLISNGGGGTIDGSPTYLRDITDGLSTTAMFSEKLVVDLEVGLRTSTQAKRDPLRYNWIATRDFQVGQDLELAMYCIDPANQSTASVGGGSSGWATVGAESPYSHIASPNAWSFRSLNNDQIGAFNASSNHPGGVHVLLADGSVRFVSSSIGLPVWWALGSRNGNESVGEF